MLPDKLWSDDACYVLFEGAELKGELRETLLANEGGALRPLLIHPDVFELINLGPWLWHCQQASAPLLEKMVAQGLVQGLIHSQRSLDVLQQQLAMGCMVIEPNGQHSQLLRFYTASALPVMLAQRDLPWHASIFGGLSDWWCRQCDGQWKHYSIDAKLADLRVITLTDELQAALMGDPEVPRLLTMWQGSVRFQQFPACIRTDMAVKALKTADDAGAPSSDRLIWGLTWLEGGRPALEELRTAVLEDV